MKRVQNTNMLKDLKKMIIMYTIMYKQILTQWHFMIL